MSTKSPTSLNRRSFLKMAGAGAGAAGMAAVVSGAQAGETSLPSQDNKHSATGYRETDHIKLYYALARR